MHLARLFGLVLICAMLWTQAALAQGEHARRAAAELRLVEGDARLLATDKQLPDQHIKGLKERIAGSLSALGLLLRLVDQETGSKVSGAQRKVRFMRTLSKAGNWFGVQATATELAAAYPLVRPALSAGPDRAQAIHEDLCAACHDEPDLDVERPARDLFQQSKAMSEPEFLARLIIGVRGDRVTGFSNPLTAPELRALSDYYRSNAK